MGVYTPSVKAGAPGAATCTRFRPPGGPAQQVPRGQKMSRQELLAFAWLRAVRSRKKNEGLGLLCERATPDFFRPTPAAGRNSQPSRCSPTRVASWRPDFTDPNSRRAPHHGQRCKGLVTRDDCTRGGWPPSSHTCRAEPSKYATNRLANRKTLQGKIGARGKRSGPRESAHRRRPRPADAPRGFWVKPILAQMSVSRHAPEGNAGSGVLLS